MEKKWKESILLDICIKNVSVIMFINEFGHQFLLLATEKLRSTHLLIAPLTKLPSFFRDMYKLACGCRRTIERILTNFVANITWM
jgi:hypothetical protein